MKWLTSKFMLVLKIIQVLGTLILVLLSTKYYDQSASWICCVFLSSQVFTLVLLLLPTRILKARVDIINDKVLYFVYYYIYTVYGNLIGFMGLIFNTIIGIFLYYVIFSLALFHVNLDLNNAQFLCILVYFIVFWVTNTLNNVCLLIFSLKDADDMAIFVKKNLINPKNLSTELIQKRIILFNNLRLTSHVIFGCFWYLNAGSRFYHNNIILKGLPQNVLIKRPWVTEPAMQQATEPAYRKTKPFVVNNKTFELLIADYLINRESFLAWLRKNPEILDLVAVYAEINIENTIGLYNKHEISQQQYGELLGVYLVARNFVIKLRQELEKK